MAMAKLAAEKKTFPCHVCGKSFPSRQLRPRGTVRKTVSQLIENDHPGWVEEGQYICDKDLARYRRAYMEQLLRNEQGYLGRPELAVLDSIESGEMLAQETNTDAQSMTTFGDRMADHVANFGGSWTFILSFASILVVWIITNVVGLLATPFDPYPFILLNLVLSSLAALQAPIIMMSQRRQDQKDRISAENDYKVNLKAELEIRHLHEKIDHQLLHQWEKLAELQQLQIELLAERGGKSSGRS